MANRDHMKILKQGASVWNAWRAENIGITPELYRADLNGLGFKLNINGLDLSGADLRRSDLSGSHVRNWCLDKANLFHADLRGAHIINSTLSHADLRSANLSNAVLSGSTLDHAIVYETTFAGLDLRNVQGLETIEHQGPSDVSVNTIYRSEGKIPEVFLRGCGVPDRGWRQNDD
ncbi:MAG TPA: pentapeptide repeat-containing protein [Pyrinomonadaceae bacterium]|nr:pentapeptide repeat-containing protein [Pyrinomonadaceae bacterium]